LLDRATQHFDAGAIRHPMKIAAEISTDRSVHRSIIGHIYPRGIVDHIDGLVWRTWKKIRART